MNHADRLVHITNEERYFIVGGLELLKCACIRMNDLTGINVINKISRIFCEENWDADRLPNTGKVKRIEAS